MKFIFIIFILPTACLALCDYPHNPPAVCLSGIITSSSRPQKTKLPCLYKVKLGHLIRPGQTYHYNDKLELVTYPKAQKLEQKIIALYSKGPCLKTRQKIRTLAIYNCSDWYAEIPDLALIDNGAIEASVRDPWKGPKTFFDCDAILKKFESKK